MYNFSKKFIKAHTLAECLEEYDCSYQSLWLWCKLHNVKYIKNRKTKEKVYNENLPLLAGTKSDKDVADELGISRTEVMAYRYEHNIKAFGKHKKHKAVDINEILAEYNELGTLQKVADKHGVTRERVRQWFASAGYRYVQNIGYVK